MVKQSATFMHIYIFLFIPPLFRSQRLPTTSRSPNVHALPNPGAGEGVPLQPLPHPPTKDRDSPRALPHRTSGQDLVPEPTDEAQEGDAGRAGDKRAGEEGKGGDGESEE